MAESNTWKGKENLKNVKKAIKEFEKKYQQDIEDVARQEHEKGIFKRGELLGRFMARNLFGWLNKWYDQEYQGRLERNWRWWKEKQLGKRRIEIIVEEKETEEKKSGVRE